MLADGRLIDMKSSPEWPIVDCILVGLYASSTKLSSLSELVLDDASSRGEWSN